MAREGRESLSEHPQISFIIGKQLDQGDIPKNFQAHHMRCLDPITYYRVPLVPRHCS